MTGTLGVLVVVPSDVARQMVAAGDGDGTFVGPMGHENSLISLRLDTIEPIDDARLQRALLIAYDASFGKRRSDRTQPPCQ